MTVRFDWLAFCRRNNIQFVTAGPNTAKGNISIQCPFCGSADESQHMGLKLDPRDPQWGCFRNASHRGRHPAFLIARLLGIGFKAAMDLVNVGQPLDSYEEALESLKTPTNPPETPRLGAGKNRPLTMPKEFKRLEPSQFKAGAFLSYLSFERGFGQDAPNVAKEQGLHYALHGEQAYRIVFPVHAPDGKLAGWTGRSIAHGAPIRYLAMPGMGKNEVYAFPPPARRGNRGHKVLIVVEGPMDALKLNTYGEGIHAVATMGTSFTDGQLVTIVTLRSAYRKIVVLTDRGAMSEGLQLAEALSTYARQDIPALQLPEPFKDAGEMPKAAIKSFCSMLVK